MKNDLINGRTPGDLKDALMRCGRRHCKAESGDCPYYIDCLLGATRLKLMKDAFDYIRHLESERDAALKCVHHSCATCNHAMYRVLAEGAGCKTISVFCKGKECRDGEKWEPCEARMDEEDK